MINNLFKQYNDQIEHVRQLMQIELDEWRLSFADDVLTRIAEFFHRPAKFIRPLIVVMMCDGRNDHSSQAYAAAAAVEIYHNATLMYDDLQDNSEFRRGRPSMHISTSTSLAMSIAGLTRTLMYHPIRRCTALTITEKAYLHQVLDMACTQVTLGQALESVWRFHNVWDVEPDHYFAMIQRKTGGLLAACFEIGAYLSGLDEQTVTAMHHFGLNFGILFQLKNDYLDLVGDTSVTGRPRYDDIREGKRTLFVIHTLQELACRGKTETIREIQELLSGDSLSGVQVIRCKEIIDSTGSVGAVKSEIDRRLSDLQQDIRHLPLPGDQSSKLLSLVGYLASWGE